MTDVVLLNLALKKAKVKKNDLANALGISRQALWKKMKGLAEWTSTQIVIVQKLLNLTDEETMDIFLKSL